MKLLIIVVAVLTVPVVQMAKAQPFEPVPFQLQLPPSEYPTDTLRLPGETGTEVLSSKAPVGIDFGSVLRSAQPGTGKPLLDAPGKGYREQRDQRLPRVSEPL